MGLNKQELLGKKNLTDFEKRWLADRNVDHPALRNADDVPAPGDVEDSSDADTADAGDEQPPQEMELPPYEEMSHADLAAEAKARGIKATGSKADLIERLEAFDNENAQE